MQLADDIEVGSLRVPGASLHYESRGRGQLLLLIAGGPQDAGVFGALATELADRYRVVAYDPRGNSRSRFDGEVERLDLDVQGDDAAALIRALGGGRPAVVFGTSGGAQIGLNLAARHPQLVAALVAHEAPAVMLLDDPSAELAANAELLEIYRHEGAEAAMGAFFGMNGLGNEDAPPPEMEPTPEEAETFERVSGNFDYWFAHGLQPLSTYVPDVARLKAGTPRIVVGIGTASVGQPIAAMGEALARALGIVPVAFPGDHFGFEAEAAGFAAALDAAIRD